MNTLNRGQQQIMLQEWNKYFKTAFLLLEIC